MRKKAIAKIIVCSILAVVLTVAMVAALMTGALAYGGEVKEWKIGNVYLFNPVRQIVDVLEELPSGIVSFGLDSVQLRGYAEGDGAYSEVPGKIKIEWAAGRIVIAATENADGVRLTEYYGNVNPFSADASSEGIPEKDHMRHQLSGKTLYIKQFQSETRLTLGIHENRTAKTLLIELPKTALDSLEIDAALTDVVLTDLTAEEADFDCATGTLTATGCAFRRFDGDFSIVSGTFSDGTIDRLDLDCASGELTFELNEAPEKIDVDAAAGTYRFVLPSDASFEIDQDTLPTAKISTVGFSDITVRNGKTVVNGGRKTYSFDMVAGKVTIEAKN